MKSPISAFRSYFSYLAIFSYLLLSTTFSLAQDVRCGTMYVDSLRYLENPDLQTHQEFESWMSKMIIERKKFEETAMIINGVYQIPVVVHVIHNGEAVGSGTNISAAAIQSQIDVLNEDFRRIFGSNGWNTHPDGADTEIEFCLAKRRPDGTGFPAGDDGINRINRNSVGWTAPPYTTTYIDGTIKPYCTNTHLGGWDPADYMNFWSCNISGGILGYAQFPTTVLGGMGCGAQSASTDGVVMLYSSIGKSAVTGFPAPYNEGRTATHEIGHWLGLRHIWGDGGCAVDDFCLDTPLSAAANFGCPSINSCTDPAPNPPDMVENYMDYTDDLCMNIFTNDQKMRMRIVLENSPIRASLITSDACIPPAVSDASIVNVLNPVGDNCPGSIAPSVTLRNRGASNLTSATILYKIDNGTPVSFSWTGTLTPGNNVNVTLPAFTATYGTHTIKAFSTLPNGVTDPHPAYDTTELQFAVSSGYQPNYSQDFDGGVFPPDVRWNDVNPNGDCYQWVGQACVSSTGVSNNVAAMMTNYGNTTNQDEYLYTPIYILPCNATSVQVAFDKAYRKRITGSTDRLRVEMSLDCGTTWPYTIFDQSGTALQTGTTINSSWIPTAASNWANVAIDLTSYVTASSQNVRFRFRATNAGSGGNIFVDNYSFTALTPAEIQVTASGLDVLDEGSYTFGTTSVGATNSVTFTVSNTGTSNLVLSPPINVTGAPNFALNSSFVTTTVAPGASTTFVVDFTPSTSGVFTGNVSFGTNDCDESTYNFQLQGTGNVNPPVAAFTASPTTLCEGNTVTFTDASVATTSWSWSFPGGTPSTATGVGPHTITYNTAGVYSATLTATNSFGSDVETQNNLITVLSGSGTALPITEGFVNTTFPPANWSIVNGGNAITWVRSGTQGTAPTAGNSAYIDNYSTNTSGNVDDLVMPAASFTGLTSAQLQFDVAYARYDATYYDRLDVLVSDDCGQTWDIVYSKSGTTLATQADQTAAYTAPTTWRQETIDLSAYVGSPKVEVKFSNISGYGQYLYIDNVNLSGVVSAVNADFSMTPSPACVGENVTFTDLSVGATSWDWNFGTGASPATATTAGPHSVSYASSGVINVTLSVNGGASVSNQNLTVNSLDNAGFTYSSSSYCSTGTDPTPTISGLTGGTFSALPAGLVINPSTGIIDLSLSTPGTYTVTYQTNGPCPNSATVSVTVNPSPAAPTISASGPTTFCSGGSVVLTSSASSGNVWSTSATSNSISVSTSGSYTVTYTDGNGCSATSTATVVTVNSTPAAPTISASGPTTFCSGGSVVLTSSASSGNVWSTSATSNSISVSTSGSYTVTYTDGNGCSATSTATVVTVNANPVISAGTIINPVACGSATGSIEVLGSGSGIVSWTGMGSGNSGTVTLPYTINSLVAGSYSVSFTDLVGCNSNSINQTLNDPSAPTAPTISASGSTTFCSGGSVVLTSSASSGNSWSTGATTNSIVVSTSGSYTVTYTDGGGCSATSTATVVTVNPTPAAPIITASGSTTFCSGGSVVLTSSASSGNVWSTTATTNSISVSTSGSYSVTYTDGNGCSATSTATVVTVNTTPTAPTISASGPTTFCSGGSVVLTSSASSGNVWSTTETTNSISVSTSGSYTVTYTDGNGCSVSSTATVVTVNANPVISAGTIINPVICASATGSIEVLGSSSGVVSWTGMSSGNSGTVTLPYTINSLVAGSYSVSFTDLVGCNSNSINQTLNDPSAPTAPTITANGPTTFCSGGSVILTSSESSGNSWSTGETTNSIVVNSSGTYTVTFTDGGGCSATSTATVVTVNSTPAAPTITASGPTTFCSGGSVVLTSSASSGNVWSTTETTNSISVSTSGSYTVTYTDGNGCSATSTPETVVVNDSPLVTLEAFGIVCLQDNAFSLGGGNPAGGVYSGPGISSNTFDPSLAGVGIHTITYTYTDVNSCQGVATETIQVDDCSSLSDVISFSLQVSPNPFEGKVIFDCKDCLILQIEITDAAGRLIHKIDPMTEHLEIDLIDLAPGLYYSKVLTNQFKELVRLVKFD